MTSRHLALLLGVLALGCAHAKTTDAEKTTQANQQDEQRQADKSSHKSRPRAPHRDPSAVPVASSAQGLLKPGAEQQIREKLAARGFIDSDAPSNGAATASLRAPLERFQDANDLPATGTPDAETLRKLGLNPDDVLRKATTGQPDGAEGARKDATERRPAGAPE